MACTCETEHDAHACPFQEEINGVEDDEYCTCCEDCTYDCAMEI